MTMKPTCLVTALLLLASAPLFAQAQHHETVPPESRTYSIEETGTISDLGIHAEVQPLIAGLGIAGFQVTLLYKDPAYANSPENRFLNKKIFHSSCLHREARRQVGTYTWTNERKATFKIHLFQSCKQASVGISIPFLEIEIRCSTINKELRLLRARQEGRVFDFTPTGKWIDVPTEAGRALELAEDIYEVYDSVSTILVVLDLVAASHGTLTAGQFVLKVVRGALVDATIEASFKYLESEYAMKVEFAHSGWTIVCRLCGRRFNRDSLAEGELLRCPNPSCRAAAYLHFP